MFSGHADMPSPSQRYSEQEMALGILKRAAELQEGADGKGRAPDARGNPGNCRRGRDRRPVRLGSRGGARASAPAHRLARRTDAIS